MLRFIQDCFNRVWLTRLLPASGRRVEAAFGIAEALRQRRWSPPRMCVAADAKRIQVAAHPGSSRGTAGWSESLAVRSRTRRQRPVRPKAWASAWLEKLPSLRTTMPIKNTDVVESTCPPALGRVDLKVSDSALCIGARSLRVLRVWIGRMSEMRMDGMPGLRSQHPRTVSPPVVGTGAVSAHRGLQQDPKASIMRSLPASPSVAMSPCSTQLVVLRQRLDI